jgi:hypothetical protein
VCALQRVFRAMRTVSVERYSGSDVCFVFNACSFVIIMLD